MTPEEVDDYIRGQLAGWQYPQQLAKCLCGRDWHGIPAKANAFRPHCKGSHVSA